MRVLIAAFSVMILCAGCVPLLIGAGAAAGYTLTNDSAIKNIKTDYRTLWDETQHTLKSMEAEILQNDESRGLIRARITGHDVTISIRAISPEIQRLKVSSRRYMLPKPLFAQKVFLRIIENF